MEGEPGWQRSRATERPSDAAKIAQSIARWHPDPFYGFILDRHPRRPTLFLPRAAVPGGFFLIRMGHRLMRAGRPMVVKSLLYQQDAGRDRNSTIRILDVASNGSLPCPGRLGCSPPAGPRTEKSIAADAFDVSSIHVFNIKTQQWSTHSSGLAGMVSLVEG